MTFLGVTNVYAAETFETDVMVKSSSGDNKVMLTTEGNVMAGSLSLYPGGAYNYMGKSANIFYDESSEWNFCTYDSKRNPTPLTVVSSKMSLNGALDVSGTSLFNGEASFDAPAEFRNDVRIRQSTLRYYGDGGYESTRIDETGLSTSNRFTLWTGSLIQSSYSHLEFKSGKDGSGYTNFFVTACAESSSGNIFYPLNFNARDFIFKGNSLSLKSQSTDSAMINLSDDGTVSAGALSLRGGEEDSLELKLDKKSGVWDFLSSSTLRMKANNFGVIGGNMYVENSDGNTMVSMNIDGSILSSKLFLRRDGASSYRSPTLSVMYNTDMSAWELFPSTYTNAPGSSGSLPAPLNMNVSKMTVAGASSFAKCAEFEDSVKAHKDMLLYKSGIYAYDADGYRRFVLSPNGSMSALKEFALFSENGPYSYYPSLRITGQGDLSAASFSISTRLSIPSGVHYYPLKLTAEDFNFHGNSLTLKKLESDSTVINLSEDGTVNAGGLKLRQGGVDSGKNPTLEIQYNEDKSAWILDATGDSASAPAVLTMKVSELNVDGPIVCKDQMKVAEIEAEKMRVNDVTVNMDHAADYVFDENYDLKSLDEVEAFVKENKHLPGVPSASKMKEEGMSLSEMSNLLLEKVEELTLHLIRVEKENRELKAEMERMRNEK